MDYKRAQTDKRRNMVAARDLEDEELLSTEGRAPVVQVDGQDGEEGGSALHANGSIIEMSWRCPANKKQK